MDWIAEANAIIDEIKPFVSRVKLITTSSWVQLEIETLEANVLSVKLDDSGFTILEQTTETRSPQSQPDTYETINALLSSISPGFRKAFAEALISSLKACTPSQQEDDTQIQD